MTLAASCVMDSSTGDIILKLVNTGKDTGTFNVNLSGFRNIKNEAEKTILTGDPDSENTFENSQNVVPYSSTDKVSSRFEYSAPAMSLTVFRIRTK